MHHIDLVSHWRLRAPPQQVWAALIDTASWPQWWPCVLAVQTLEDGDADGVGCVRRIDWSTRWPSHLRIDVQIIESVPHERLRAWSRGALQGEGIWLLAAEGTHSIVTCVWRIDLQRGWMRWLAPVLAPAMTPLLAPLYRWNHASVMRAGEAGLARWLARLWG